MKLSQNPWHCHKMHETVITHNACKFCTNAWTISQCLTRRSSWHSSIVHETFALIHNTVVHCMQLSHNACNCHIMEKNVAQRMTLSKNPQCLQLTHMEKTVARYKYCMVRDTVIQLSHNALFPQRGSCSPPVQKVSPSWKKKKILQLEVTKFAIISLFTNKVWRVVT